MGVKTRTKGSQGAKDETERDSAAASPSPSDDSSGERRSLRVRNDTGDEMKDVSEKGSDSERKIKANAAGAAKGYDRNQDSETEPMETEETEKTSKETDSHDNTHEPVEQRHHKHHHRHHHHEHRLSEGTLKRLKAYLQSDMVMDEGLDEDAVAGKILKLDRAASDRVRYLQDPYADSDDEDTPDQSYQAAEEYMLALDFYKRTITDTQGLNVNAPLDKKTLNWLRKALGLHKRNELWETSGHELKEDTEESEGDEEGSQGKSKKSKRTVTRGMVRSTRIKRRAERETKESMNLNALVSAVEDLEDTFGPLAETTGRKKRKRQKGSPENDSFVEERASKRRSRSKTPPATKKAITTKRPLIAHIRGKTKAVSKSGRARRLSWPEKIVRVKVIVGGKERAQYKQVVPVEGSKKVKTPSEQNRAQPPLSLSMRKAADRQRLREAAAAQSKAKGLLFGEVDPHQAMDLEAFDYMQESNRISLGLLDWKRRQERDSAARRASTEPTTHEAVPMKLAEAGMSTLPHWDSINPIPHMHRQPATVEPVRRRHSNERYADWINGMINILSGSGRSWALHEFFYSDIDRAWFNFDQFQVDVAKLGVPPTARLTRKEWSLVRRSIRKRPRRFSPRFIQSELAKLCQYRDIVRAIQHSKIAMPDFGFDVPAYIKVGNTVTAFHWKRRVLHRGIVIAHDPFRSGYLVQFERQELGFQFCPDYEVASHGGPDILVRAGTASLDGTYLGAFSDRHMVPGELSYGTHYGPAFLNQVDVKKDKRAKIALLDAMVANEDISAKDASPEKSLVETVAEREALVDLIGTIDAALKRKTMLLDAIDKCNKDMLSLREKHGEDALKSPESSQFMEHYSWLQANLRTTNLSLDSALVMLRTMYGSSYTSMSYQEDAAEKEAELESHLSRLREDDDVDRKLVLPWSLSIAQACTKIDNLVVRTTNDLSDKWDTMTEEEKFRAEYIEHSLSGACRLLLNMNYCGALVRSERADVGSDKGLTLNVEPMNACIERELFGLSQTPMSFSSSSTGDSKLHRADVMRDSAMKELQEALLSYETELTAMHVAKNIIRS